MSLDHDAEQLLQGFSKLNNKERLTRLTELNVLDKETVAYLQAGGVQGIDLAEKLIENVIGYFQLPLGVATNFRIDGQDYIIPLAVEETSIVAALSKTAKWVKQQGKITTEVEGNCIIGQIQFAKVNNFDSFSQVFEANRQSLINKANFDVAANMVKRGGGVTDMVLRSIVRPDGQVMAVIHLFMDSCDAMGANLINQILEYLKEPIQKLTGEAVSMCILSNLNDSKITTAKVVLSDIEQSLGEKIQEASFFAELDPYRAATHNKGVMNGIDPVLIATGNDWRAVEAAVHAYAARDGQYRAITQWRYDNQKNTLTGILRAPIIVGIVGGVTAVHPTAKLCLKMMRIESANHLSRVIAAVGLLQNLGALKALCTDGIVKGHMKLHIDNLLLAVGANAEEMEAIKHQLVDALVTNKRIGLSDAQRFLHELRQHNYEHNYKREMADSC